MSYFLPPTVSNEHKPTPSPPLSVHSSKKPGGSHDIPLSQRASSLSDWMKSRLPKLPSQRPERGGTIRDRGYWEKFEAEPGGEKRIRRRAVTDTGNRSRRSETGDSDVITRWNTAKDIPPEPKINFVSPHTQVVSQEVSKLSPDNFDRKWSWAPHTETQEQLTVRQSPDGHLQASWQETRIEDEPIVELDSASLAADRRLSYARRAIEAKKEARRQRRSLKESGDYLGVQGINPDTGQLDIITPSNSENSGTSHETEQQINALRQALRDARSIYKNTALQSERELKEIIVKKEKEKQRKIQKEKEELSRLNQGLKWRRHTKQWSSAQEPNLSPIAQSLRSGPMSRRASILMNESIRDEQLVNLSSPGKQKVVQLVVPTTEDSNQDTSGGTSKSSGTVIHTPHRQSMVDMTSTAQELFENGIDFGTSDLPGENKDEGGENSARGIFGTKSESAQNHRKSIMKLPPSQGTMDDDNLTFSMTVEEFQDPENQHDAASSSAIPFLDIRAPGENLSWGLGSDLTPCPSLTDISSPMKSPTTKRSFSSLLMRGRNRLTQTLMVPHLENSKRDSMTTSYTIDLAESPSQVSATDEEVHLLLDEHPLHRISPTHLVQQWMKKRSDSGSHPVGTRGAVSTQPLDSVTNLNQVQRASSPEAKDFDLVTQQPSPPQSMISEESEPIKEKIKKEMELLRLEVAKIDGLALTKGLGEGAPLATDHEWIKDVMRDITKKGEEVMGEPASTPITTTTGSDPQPSISSQNRHTPCGRRRRRGTRAKSLSPGELMSGKAPLDWMGFRQNRALSTSPSLGLAGRPTRIDITSKRYLAPTKRRTHLVLGPTLQAAQPTDWDLAQDQYSTSPMCTSTLAPRETKTAVENQDSADSLKWLKIQDQTHRNAPVQTSISALIKEDQNMEDSLAQQVTNQGTLVLKNVTVNLAVEDHLNLRNLMVRCPGLYPSHLDDEDGIVDLIKNMNKCNNIPVHHTSKGKIGGTWDALKEFVSVMLCLTRLYVSIVAPFFDSSSDYWLRNKRGEPTVGDMFAMALAVPASLLIVVTLI